MRTKHLYSPDTMLGVLTKIVLYYLCDILYIRCLTVRIGENII